MLYLSFFSLQLLGQREELSDQFIEEIRHYLELSQKITNSIKGLEYDIFPWLKYVVPKGYQPVMDAINCRRKITQTLLDDTKVNIAFCFQCKLKKYMDILTHVLEIDSITTIL